MSPVLAAKTINNLEKKDKPNGHDISMHSVCAPRATEQEEAWRLWY